MGIAARAAVMAPCIVLLFALGAPIDGSAKLAHPGIDWRGPVFAHVGDDGGSASAKGGPRFVGRFMARVRAIGIRSEGDHACRDGANRCASPCRHSAQQRADVYANGGSQGGARRTRCSKSLADLLNASTRLGEDLWDRDLECTDGTLQSFAGMLVRRFEMRDGLCKAVLRGPVPSANETPDRLRARLGLLRNGLEIGLDGPNALRRGVTDRPTRLLRTCSNMTERVSELDIRQ